MFASHFLFRGGELDEEYEDPEELFETEDTERPRTRRTGERDL